MIGELQLFLGATVHTLFAFCYKRILIVSVVRETNASTGIGISILGVACTSHATRGSLGLPGIGS